MRCIISKKYRHKYLNEITEYMDKYLKYCTDRYKTYVDDDKFNNKWTIRIPGHSVGYIEVDDNNIILDIKLHEDTSHYYNNSVMDEIHKFYNMKLIMES